MKEPRIITLDIETAPMKSYHWGLWEQNIGLDMIGDDWTILSYAVKTYGKSGVMYHDTTARTSLRDDSALVKELWHLLNDADIIVGHNARSFDIKKINARLLCNGFGPYSPIRVVDTLTSTKANFSFPSNKLEYLTGKLTENKKLKHKRFPGFELWAQYLEANPKAWHDMKVYNKRDVVATEELYTLIRPWITNHPNMGAYSPTTVAHACPKCGSHDTAKNGVRVTQQGRYHRYQCNACGGWSRGKEMVLSLAERRKMLVPQ